MSLFLKTNDFPKGNSDEISSDFWMTVPSKKKLKICLLWERNIFKNVELLFLHARNPRYRQIRILVI